MNTAHKVVQKQLDAQIRSSFEKLFDNWIRIAKSLKTPKTVVSTWYYVFVEKEKERDKKWVYLLYYITLHYTHKLLLCYFVSVSVHFNYISMFCCVYTVRVLLFLVLIGWRTAAILNILNKLLNPPSIYGNIIVSMYVFRYLHYTIQHDCRIYLTIYIYLHICMLSLSWL